MVKKYLATQDDVQIVSDDVATINTQLNTPVTGLDARVQATEAYETRITQAESDIDGLDTQINDPTVGIVKQLVDVDTELNEATTGVKARITDLEQGGTSTTKFRIHSPSGVYEDGEAVQLNDIIYKANSVIDGSVTPVPFVVGNGANMWTALDKKDPTSQVAFQDSDTGSVTVMQGLGGSMLLQSFSTTTPPNRIDWTFNPDRCRVSYVHNGNQATIAANDVLRLMDVTGAISNTVTTNLTPNRAMISSSSGKLLVSNVTTAELAHLDGVTSAIQTQLNGKKGTFPNALGIAVYGTVSSGGTAVDGTGFICRKITTGEYEIYGMPTGSIYTPIYAESISDDDNMYVIYNRNATSFRIRWSDIPNMTLQNIDFRFSLMNAY